MRRPASTVVVPACRIGLTNGAAVHATVRLGRATLGGVVGYFETPWHIALLLLIVLLLFGGKRLPEMGRSLGRGMREFKDGITGHSATEQPELPPRDRSAASPTASEHETL